MGCKIPKVLQLAPAKWCGLAPVHLCFVKYWTMIINYSEERKYNLKTEKKSAVVSLRVGKSDDWAN